MIINGDWSLGDYEGIVNYGLVRIPRVSETGLWPSPMVSTKGYSINVNTEGEKLRITKDLIRYLTSDEVQIISVEDIATDNGAPVIIYTPEG